MDPHEIKEQEFQSARLLWIPTVPMIGVDQASDLTEYWRRVEDFVAPARTHLGTVRLYLEGVLGSDFGGREYFDKYYSGLFEKVVGQAVNARGREKSENSGAFSQWEIILKLLNRKGNTVIEVCDDEQVCFRSQEILARIRKASNQRERKILRRRYRGELTVLDQKRKADFIERINKTLLPGEIGVVILGLESLSPSMEVKSGIKVELMPSLLKKTELTPVLREAELKPVYSSKGGS